MITNESIEELRQLPLKELEEKIKECDKGFDEFRCQNGKLDHTKFREIAQLQNKLNLIKTIRDEKLSQLNQ